MSPAQREKVVKMLKAGHFVTTACRSAGISRDHFYDSKADDPSFKAEAEGAMADAEEACLAAISSDPAWQSRAWILERRFAERWAKKPDVIAPTASGAVTVTLPADPAERAAVLRALAAKAEQGT